MTPEGGWAERRQQVRHKTGAQPRGCGPHAHQDRRANPLAAAAGLPPVVHFRAGARSAVFVFGARAAATPPANEQPNKPRRRARGRRGAITPFPSAQGDLRNPSSPPASAPGRRRSLAAPLANTRRRRRCRRRCRGSAAGSRGAARACWCPRCTSSVAPAPEPF